jgi:hypothetical protein
VRYASPISCVLSSAILIPWRSTFVACIAVDKSKQEGALSPEGRRFAAHRVFHLAGNSKTQEVERTHAHFSEHAHRRAS